MVGDGRGRGVKFDSHSVGLEVQAATISNGVSFFATVIGNCRRCRRRPLATCEKLMVAAKVFPHNFCASFAPFLSFLFFCVVRVEGFPVEAKGLQGHITHGRTTRWRFLITPRAGNKCALKLVTRNSLRLPRTFVKSANELAAQSPARRVSTILRVNRMGYFLLGNRSAAATAVTAAATAISG